MKKETSLEHDFICSECSWFVRPENGRTQYDLNVAAIKHYGETGHSIETRSALNGEPNEGWADQWPP